MKQTKQQSCKALLITIVSTLAISSLTAQTSAESLSDKAAAWKNPSVGAIGRAPLRSEFISYDIREEAANGVREVSPFFLPLNMFSTEREGVKQLRTRIEIPYMWLDRDLFLHVEGAGAFYLTVNDKRVGYGDDARTPIEFYLSPHVTNGLNTIALETMEGSTGAQIEITGAVTQPQAFIYSQPKLRIEDFTLGTEQDSTGRHSKLSLDLALANSYNSDEKITVGYDVYSPQGKLLYYDMRESNLKGQGKDTIRFRETIYATAPNLWSSSSPNLYRVMFYVKRAGRMTEYIPFQAGFGQVGFESGKVTRNGKPLELKIASYNGAPTAPQLQKELTTLKAHGINTVIVDYPLPWWFYNMCDKVGMNVIDQANINTAFDIDNRNVGGSLTNNPLWLGSYMERVQRMYVRNRNHACIIAWSLGGNVGNGYNMYKCYEWLKGADPLRAVVMRDARGEWNSDMVLPTIADGAKLLATPVPTAAPHKTVRRR